MYEYITSLPYSILEAFCIFTFTLFLGWTIKLALENTDDNKKDSKNGNK